MTGLWIVQQAVVPEGLDTPLLQRGMGIVGIAVMIGIAWSMSSDRSKVSWRLVGFGVALQVAFGFLVLKTGVGQALFDGLCADCHGAGLAHGD